MTSASGTSVDFTVPLDALDGYVELCHVGGCDSIAFSTGASSFSNPPWYTRPDPADLDVYGSGRFWMERVLVSYTGNVDTTDAETVMDDAVAALTNLTGYSEVGYLPLDNTYVWELTWNGSETLSDYEDLVDQLAAEADVDGLLAETPANTQDVLGFGMDVGMMWSGVQDEYAAHDLIGAEEAWRLLATSYPGTTLGEVAVHIIDSGMWNNADADGNTPFDEDHVRYFVKDASGEWAEGTLSVASDEYMSSGWSHGAAVASIIGTTNHQSPAWDGAEGTHGLSGILAGVQQYGVDDDGDGYTDLDDTDGEAFPFELGVWNFFTNSTESSGFTTKTNAQIY